MHVVVLAIRNLRLVLGVSEVVDLVLTAQVEGKLVAREFAFLKPKDIRL